MPKKLYISDFVDNYTVSNMIGKKVSLLSLNSKPLTVLTNSRARAGAEPGKIGSGRKFDTCPTKNLMTNFYY